VQSWESALRDLRAEYVVGARRRAEEASRLVAHLASDPADERALADLMHRFHGLAGSGTTYGFPHVSETALGAERACAELLASRSVPALGALDELRGAASALLAALDPSLPPEPGSEEAAPPPARATRRVLVVDADPATLATLEPLLAREGLAATGAASLAEAAAALEDGRPDGIVVAARLPDGSGHDVARRVRARHGVEPPVVMIGAAAAFVDKVGAIQSGSDAFFEKPVDGEKLLRRLQDLLERERDEPARVLCVEDDVTQAAFVRAVLQSAGYQVFICADPRRFESSMASFRPDLVLMDLLLPGVSGHDLVRYVRQDERFASLPVILMTTDAHVEAEIATLRAGGDDHLAKPVPPGLLLSSVAARLDRARALKGRLDRDGLTRLLTHTALVERARAIVARKRRDPARGMAWAMIDLDHFKAVNDRYGHPAGDRVIAALASLLRRRVRQTDTIGRYGGEEFALLLDGLGPGDALALVDRLRREFDGLAFTAPGGTSFHATFSAGIAMLGPDMSVEAWRDAADEALYAAKEAGRDRLVLAGGPGE
jgi:diguanylate cyclase (GGDEF)-like protein